MPEVTIVIGGRNFEVACREGEEHFLASAAAMLDEEARTLQDSIGRVPEPKMLLMSGLMLADRTAALEEKLEKLASTAAAKPEPAVTEADVLKLNAEMASLKASLAESEAKMAQIKAESSEKDAEIAVAKQDAARATEAKEAAFAALNRMAERVESVAQNVEQAG